MQNFYDINIVWGILSLLAWGIADYLARLASLRTGSLSTAFYVQAIGIVPPALYLIYWMGIAGPDRPLEWATLAIVGPVVAIFWCLGYLAYYRGLEKGMVSVVTAITSCWLVVSILLATLFLGETVSSLQAVVIAGITAGILLLALQRNTPQKTYSGFRYGIFAMLTLGTTFALWKPLSEAVGPFIAVGVPRVMATVLIGAFARANTCPSGGPHAVGGGYSLVPLCWTP